MAHIHEATEQFKENMRDEAIYMAEWLALSGYKPVGFGPYKWKRDGKEEIITSLQLYDLYLESY